MSLSCYLDELATAATHAAAVEDGFRRDIAARLKALERDRVHAFRRLNLMRTIAEAIAPADSPEIAVAATSAVLRHRLGWAVDSEARAEVLSRFAPIALAMFGRQHDGKQEDGQSEKRDVGQELAAFEGWYGSTHTVAFWELFEIVMPETPLVDF